jgi:hypothetical protein
LHEGDLRELNGYLAGRASLPTAEAIDAPSQAISASESTARRRG